MSNWTKEEVDALREENGGGNDVARRVWLGKWNGSLMRKPKDTDHLDYFKRFIDRVYNERAFYDDNGYHQSKNRSTSSVEEKRKPKKESSEKTATNVNLLDFPSPTGKTTSMSVGSPGSDGWGDFSTASPPRGAPVSHDEFGAFASAQPQSQPLSSSTFGPFGISSSTPTPTSAPVSSGASSMSFDPFGSINAFPNASPAPAPVSSSSSMNHGSFAQFPVTNNPASTSSRNFSAFDALSSSGQPVGQCGMPSASGMGMNRPGTGNQGAPLNHGIPNLAARAAYGMNSTGAMHMAGPTSCGFAGYSAAGSAMPGASASQNISNLFDPTRQQQTSNGPARAVGVPGSSRDPFAGLGLPH